MKKQEQGITLVALVITIIVLLILAGVTINLVLGDNGILNKAKISGEEYTKASIKEEIELAIADLSLELASKVPSESLDNQKIIDNLGDRLDDSFTINSTLKGEYKGYQYYIDEHYEVHIGDKASTIITLTLNIDKIGTTYFTVSTNATSTQGNIVEYIYIIDGIEKPAIQDASYTETNLDETTLHRVKVRVKDEQGNEKESKEYKITTEPKIYLYKDGQYNPLIGGYTDAGHFGRDWGAFYQYEDKFSCYTYSHGTCHYIRSNLLVDFSEYSKLGAIVSGAPRHSAWYGSLFLETRTSSANWDNHRGNTGVYDEFIYTNRSTCILDVSSFNGQAYIYARSTHGGHFYIQELWLEK